MLLCFFFFSFLPAGCCSTLHVFGIKVCRGYFYLGAAVVVDVTVDGLKGSVSFAASFTSWVVFFSPQSTQ